MGAAKRRGTYEQRKAQAIERNRIQAEQERKDAEERRLAEIRAKHERIRALTPEERREQVFIHDGNARVSRAELLSLLAAPGVGALLIADPKQEYVPSDISSESK